MIEGAVCTNQAGRRWLGHLLVSGGLHAVLLSTAAGMTSNAGRDAFVPRAPIELELVDIRHAWPDGGYFWDGHAITATITPTGRVNFENRPAIEFDGFLPPPPKEPPRWLDEQFIRGSLIKERGLLRFRFGLTDMLARAAGDEPYTAERVWFMEQTRALRARLAKNTERDGT